MSLCHIEKKKPRTNLENITNVKLKSDGHLKKDKNIKIKI